MKNILFALLFIPLLSGKRITATIDISCNPCTANSLIQFTGSGYTPGRTIAVNVTEPDGNTFQFDGGIVDAAGNISFTTSFISTGIWNLKVYEVRNRTHWIYKSEINITIQ